MPFCFVTCSCGVLFGLMVLFTAHSYLTNTFFSVGAAGVCGLTVQVRAGDLGVTFPLPVSVQPRATVGLLPFPRNSASLGFVPWEVSGHHQSLPQPHERESLRMKSALPADAGGLLPILFCLVGPKWKKVYVDKMINFGIRQRGHNPKQDWMRNVLDPLGPSLQGTCLSSSRRWESTSLRHCLHSPCSGSQDSGNSRPQKLSTARWGSWPFFASHRGRSRSWALDPQSQARFGAHGSDFLLALAVRGRGRPPATVASLCVGCPKRSTQHLMPERHHNLFTQFSS